LADRNQVTPEFGMWAPNMVLLIFALYLTLYTIRERAPISFLSFLSKRKN